MTGVRSAASTFAAVMVALALAGVACAGPRGVPTSKRGETTAPTAAPSTAAPTTAAPSTAAPETAAPATLPLPVAHAATPPVPPAPAPLPTAVEVPPGADLYAFAPALTDEAPGTLLRYQAMPTFPDALGFVAPGRRWRVMYVSSDDAGRPIPVTGTIRVPDGRPPAGGWPVVTWAHGTTGAADRCAPSMRPDTAPEADVMAFDGFVVAATDYAGLGTPGLHPYLDGPSEGRAVLDIVVAAAALPGSGGADVGRNYAVWGHSQGGHAALFARQLAGERLPGRHLLGTVAWAPVSLVADTVSAILVALQPKGLAILAVTSLAATRPDARIDRVLTPEAVAAALAVVDSGCVDDVSRGMSLLADRPVVTSPPNLQEPWRTYLHLNEPAVQAGAGPLLLIQSADDRVVPPVMSAVVKQRTCSRGEPTQRWLLAGGGHAVVVGDTRPAARAWTLDRLAGTPAPNGCGQSDGPP